MIYATTVVRSSSLGETHGGLYGLDFQTGEAIELLQWSDKDFDFAGRGGDRGLRGLVYRDGVFYVAAADRILVVSPSGTIERSIRHPLLGLLHEIVATDNGFWVVSTRHDSILHYDISLDKFTNGIFLDHVGKTHAFDPDVTSLPADNVWHINSVCLIDGSPAVSGLRLPGLVHLNKATTVLYGLPLGTHNARKDWGLLMYCDTEMNALRVEGSKFPVPSEVRVNSSGMARSRFMRGLVVKGDELFVGVSPARVYSFDLNRHRWGKSVVISEDFRVAVQSLCIGPVL